MIYILPAPCKDFGDAGLSKWEVLSKIHYFHQINTINGEVTNDRKRHLFSNFIYQIIQKPK